MASPPTPTKKSALSIYQNFLEMLINVGVPNDARWCSLILYFREMKDYTHFSNGQKSAILALLAETLSKKQFSESDLHNVLSEYKKIAVGPCIKTVDELMREASSMISSFQELLTTRYDNIHNLEELTINVVESELDQEKLVAKLRNAFKSVKSQLENDMRSLEHLATCDGLTTIGNRRAFDAFLTKALEPWAARGRQLGMALFDIDFFKRFNDEHGHRIGDQVLQLVAKYIARSAQTLIDDSSESLAARYGGEELALLVSGPEATRLPEIAESIRLAICNFNFVLRDTDGKVVEDSLHITVSVGVARCRQEWGASARDSLVDYSDKAMYAAKQAGRNRTMVYAPKAKEGFRLVTLDADGKREGKTD